MGKELSQLHSANPCFITSILTLPICFLTFLLGLSTTKLNSQSSTLLNSLSSSHLLVCFSCGVFDMFCGLPPLRLIGRSA